MNRPFQFHERSQLFIGTHDKTLSVAMSVYNPRCSPFKIEYSDALPFVGLWHGESNEIGNAISYAQFYSRSHDAVIRVLCVDQLCVKVAVSVMGPPIVIEAGLLVPVKEPVPLPVQLVKLYPLAGVA